MCLLARAGGQPRPLDFPGDGVDGGGSGMQRHHSLLCGVNGEDAEAVQAERDHAGRRRVVSFTLHHLWRDVCGAVRMTGHPVIRIIRAKEFWQDKDHPQDGLVPDCRCLAGLVLLLTLFSLFFFLSVEAHFKHKP